MMKRETLLRCQNRDNFGTQALASGRAELASGNILARFSLSAEFAPTTARSGAFPAAYMTLPVARWRSA